ncbi:MAG: fibronectin type III domain-containing protein [Actinoplanes sp.]
MRSRLTGPKLAGAIVLVAVLAVIGLPIIFSSAPAARAMEFLQVGHWVFNTGTHTAFHIHGGSKEVDAKIALPSAAEGGMVLQGDKYGFVMNGKTVVGFGKSTLTVAAVIPTGLAGKPIGIEVPGGPYLVFQEAGRVVRLGLPAVIMPVGGPVSSAVGTDDGTVWLRRADTGDICRVGAAETAPRCAVRASGAATAKLTVVAGRPALFDPAAGTLAVIDGDAVGKPTRVTAPLPATVEVSTSDTDGRLPVLDPTGRLLLADTGWVGADRRPAAQPLTISLGAGRYRNPVATSNSVALLDVTRSRVLTYGRDGRRLQSEPVAAPADRARVVRGGDGKVYVDDAAGAHTLVVDPDGTVTTVKIGGTAPTTPKQRREPPTSGRPNAPDGPPRRPDGGAPIGKGSGDSGRAARPPGSPQPVTGRPGNAQVTLDWRPAAPNGGRILAYDVTWTSSDGSPGGTVSVPGSRRTTVVTGLGNGVAYTFAVLATNSAGVGPAAVSAPVTPSSDVPGTPGEVSATADDDGSVAVTWQPADGLGNTVTGYEVTARGSDGSEATMGGRPTGTSLTLAAGAGLQLGVSYTFTVTATNDKGLTGLPSVASNTVAPYAPAGAPGDLHAEVSDRAVTVTWAEPDLGGGDLVEYVVAADGAGSRTGQDRAVRFDGLDNGREYAFSVRAVTRSKTGGDPVTGAEVTVAGRPGTAPEARLRGVDADGDRTVVVRVSVDEHGSGGVTCLVTLNGTERWRGGCSGDQDIRIGGLDYATDYNAQVFASNAYGSSGGSGVQGARTNDPPRTVTVGKGGRASVTGCDPNKGCRWVTIAARHFAPNTTYRVVCSASTESSYYAFDTRTDGGGDITINSGWCAYGFSGESVWVTVDGIESNHQPW